MSPPTRSGLRGIAGAVNLWGMKLSLRSMAGVIVIPGLLFVGCSTLQSVPSIRSGDLPPIRFDALNPKVIRLEISNQRPLNLQAGNAREVEQAVYAPVAEVLGRAGFQLQEKAPHFLRIEILEREAPSEGQGACLRLRLRLQARWGSSLQGEVSGCNGYKMATGGSGGVDVSETYTELLAMGLRELEKDQMKLLVQPKRR